MKKLLNRYYCNNCQRGWGYGIEAIERLVQEEGEKFVFNEEVICDHCDNKFPYYKGLINDLVEDEGFGTWDFIWDIKYNSATMGAADITVGKEYVINLPKKVLINKIILTNLGGFVAVAPHFHTEFAMDSFTIVSSEGESDHPSSKKLGDSHSLSWVLYGKSGDSVEEETWLVLLTQIKEQILQGQYNIAVLTSEMMFESFLDVTLNKLLIKQGLSQEAAYIILESMNSILTKAHKLLKELNGQGLQGQGKNPINKEWQELLKFRNKIAHGESVEVNKEKAQWALRTALDAIFFIYNSCDIYE